MMLCRMPEIRKLNISFSPSPPAASSRQRRTFAFTCTSYIVATNDMLIDDGVCKSYAKAHRCANGSFSDGNGTHVIWCARSESQRRWPQEDGACSTDCLCGWSDPSRYEPRGARQCVREQEIYLLLCFHTRARACSLALPLEKPFFIYIQLRESRTTQLQQTQIAFFFFFFIFRKTLC